MSVHYSDNHAAPQDLGLLGGKVLRFDKATGVGAADNPFPAAPLVYTYGHRNPQGLALRPGTTQMWSVEHGPLWDDEVNLLTPGANHGWNPNSEGPPGQAQYASMTDLDAFPDAVVARWTSGFSTIAPSGATFLEGDDWGEWEGRLAVATLKTLSLRLFEFSAAGEFVSQVVATNVERLRYRLRTPVLGPDGALYITTSDATNDPGTDRILRVVPSLPPAFAAPSADHTVAENINPSTVVATFAATDPEGGEVRYTLGGTDAGSFNLADERLGELRANQAFDFETRRTYEVVVDAHDPYGLTDSLTLTVSVMNLDETGGVTFDKQRPIRNQPLTATLVDPDGVQGAESWTWHRSTSRGGGWGEPIAGAGSNVFTPVAADREHYLRATVEYSDAHRAKTVQAITGLAASNMAPVLPDSVEPVSIPENTRAGSNVGGPVAASDAERDPLSYSLPGSSDFVIDSRTGQIKVADGVVLDFDAGQTSYTLTVGVDDGFGGQDSVTVTITITGVNEAPVANDDVATTDEDSSIEIAVRTDIDPDAGDTVTLLGTLPDAPDHGSATVDTADNRITYTPSANYHGPDSFSYRVQDGGGLTADATVAVTVKGVNDAPEFVSATAERSVPESAQPGANVGVPVTANDVDGDLLGYRLQGAPEFEIDEDTGQIQVAPGVTLDRERTPSYEVTVTASDGKGGIDSITVTINVSNVNEAPTAVNDTATTDEDQSVRIDVLANDTDPDTERAALTVSVLRDPLDGTARVESDRTITYTPNANFAGENSFTYRLSDGSLSDDGSVTVTVEAVNDAPAFPAATAERSVPEDAEADDNVGTPVTAMDVESALLTYSLSGADSGSFNIDSNGQIAVATGVTFDIATQETYVVTVTADDGSGEANATATVEVTITVTAGPVIIITGGGGGGGGPSPSEADFEWTVQHDIEELDGGNDRATGVWSDGTTLWVADNADGAGDTVYAYDRASGERLSEREFDLAEANRAPRGIWSDRSVVWVSDSGRERLFAYDLATGERLEEREFALAAGNSDARGIWSDEETMWVPDGSADALFAYDIASGDLLAEYELDAANDDPHGIWSDGVTFWVSNHNPKLLFAYRLPVLPDAEADSGEEDADDHPRELERVRNEEFSKLSRASNNSPRGIWSDGEVMYVADESDDRVYSYNMPDAIDARLASLTLSGVDIGEFDPGRTDYEAVVADGVTETTVEAEAMRRRADVAIDPPDADGANGHQVALEDLGEITVTVTSADDSRTRVYRVQFPETAWDPARDPWPHCLRGAVSEGFSLVVYEGGSVAELVTCAESRGIVTLYALHEGVFVSYILGAPGFVNAGFLELFPDGLPPIAPLVATSNGPPSADPFGDDLEGDGQQPWPECLRGDIAAGFSLVVYEGGSVDELEACAQSRDVAALYVLSEGEFVSYILGAPAFVNARFVELFAGGVPPMTPLVARSEGLPGGR